MLINRVSLASVAMTVALSAPIAGQVKQPPAAAGNPASTRIAFVNAATLLQRMPGYAEAESAFKKEADATKVEADRLKAAFNAAVTQYQQGQALMTQSARVAREKQLQAQQDTLQAKLRNFDAKFQARQAELLAPIQDRLRTIIEGIRAEGNYGLVLDSSSPVFESVLAYDKALDITSRVAQRLGQRPQN